MIKRNFLVLLLSGFFVLAVSSCRETKEDKMEDDVENVEEEIEDVGDAVEEGAENVGDAVEEGAEEVEEEAEGEGN